MFVAWFENKSLRGAVTLIGCGTRRCENKSLCGVVTLIGYGTKRCDGILKLALCPSCVMSNTS